MYKCIYVCTVVGARRLVSMYTHFRQIKLPNTRILLALVSDMQIIKANLSSNCPLQSNLHQKHTSKSTPFCTTKPKPNHIPSISAIRYNRSVKR